MKQATLSSTARKLGLTRQALAIHYKKPDAPPLDDIDGWQIFLAANGEEGSSPPDIRAGIAEERHKLLTATRKREELRLLKDQGKMLETAEVEDTLKSCMAVLFAALDRICEEYPPRLKGLDEHGIQTGLREGITALKADTVSRLSKLKNGA